MPVRTEVVCTDETDIVHDCDLESSARASLFHSILVSILDIPASESLPHKIFFRVYLLFAVCYSVSAMLIKLFYAPKAVLAVLSPGSGRYSSKLYTLPGYYSYLFRLKPF